MTTPALILIDCQRARLGHAARLDDLLGDKSVLEHTVDRALQVQGVDQVVLLHPQGQDVSALVAPVVDRVRVLDYQLTCVEQVHADVIASARKWSMTAWRGGIGGTTVVDELLPAGPIVRAMQQLDAQAAVIVRGDWCCFDPGLASEQLAVHLSAPEAMKLTFTQAPPGLSVLVAARKVLEDFAQHGASVANVLCYNPSKPGLDPISRDVCIAVPSSVRDQHRRFIYDTPRAIGHLRAIADGLGDALATADAQAITQASRQVECDRPALQLDHLPQQWSLELTTQRQATGWIVPQSHLDLPRTEPMDTKLACDIVKQLGDVGDASIMLGGLGDALMHPDLPVIVNAAREAGVMGIGIETDLLVEPEAIEQLAQLDVDVISVRINADSKAVYEELMGLDGYKRVLDNLQALFRTRTNNRTHAHDSETGQKLQGFQGWIVPRLIKVADNLKDLETFFERWMTLAGWAVVDRYPTGHGLIADRGPVPMDPPRKSAKPNQQKTRLSVLSDGSVVLCHHDWLAQATLGSAHTQRLSDLWRAAPGLADDILGRPENDRPICRYCQDWLSVQARDAQAALAV